MKKNIIYGQAYLKYTKYIGTKIGHLTVLALNDNKEERKKLNNSVTAHCKCDCGNNEVYRSISNLISSKSTNSICCNKCYMGTPINNLIGERYGFVTITGIESDKKNILAVCKCDCGNSFKRPYKAFKDKRNSRVNKKNTCGECFLGKPLTSFKGKVYGDLKVLNVYRKNGITIAYCQCVCGNYSERSLYSLESKTSKHPYCGKCYKGKKYEDYIGEKSGYLKILSFVNNEKNKSLIICECTCGNKIKLSLPDFCSGRISSCNKCYKGKKYEDYIGNIYNNLTIISIHYPKETKDTFVLAKCKCICNKTKLFRFSEVINNHRTSCGECYHGILYKDYIGRTFGRLLIKSILRPEDTGSKYMMVKCKCKCNNPNSVLLPLSKIIRKDYPILSCGCARKTLKQFKNISFGKLKIIDLSFNNVDGLRYICKCDCGNEIEVLESDLFTGKVTCCEECRE